MFGQSEHDVLMPLQPCKSIAVSAKDEEESPMFVSDAAEQGRIAPFSIEGTEGFDDLTRYVDTGF